MFNIALGSSGTTVDDRNFDMFNTFSVPEAKIETVCSLDQTFKIVSYVMQFFKICKNCTSLFKNKFFRIFKDLSQKMKKTVSVFMEAEWQSSLTWMITRSM